MAYPPPIAQADLTRLLDQVVAALEMLVFMGGGGGGGTVNQGSPAAHSDAWPVVLSNGTNPIGTAARPVRTDPTNDTPTLVEADSLPLPDGAATEAQQAALLADIATRLAALGQHVAASSVSVVLASDHADVPVSASSLPLPTGAATEATLLDVEAAVSALDFLTDAELRAAPVPVSAAALPLPAGAATEATLAAAATDLDAIAADADSIAGDVAVIESKTPALGAALTAFSVPVNVASDQVVPVSGPITDAELRATPVPVTATPAAAPTGTTSNVASSAASVTLLAANAARRGATLYNDSTQVCYVKFGATASATSFTVRLLSQDYYEVPFGYTGIVDGIWAAANGNMRVTEVT